MCFVASADFWQVSCSTGYEVNANGMECVDVDECVMGTAGCDHNCTNTEGSFFCFCSDGFSLEADGKTCSGRMHSNEYQ